jgi:hypothetical protein
VILVGDVGVGRVAGLVVYDAIEINLERILPIVVVDDEAPVAVVNFHQIVVQVLRPSEGVAAVAVGVLRSVVLVAVLEAIGRAVRIVRVYFGSNLRKTSIAERRTDLCVLDGRGRMGLNVVAEIFRALRKRGCAYLLVRRNVRLGLRVRAVAETQVAGGVAFAERVPEVFVGARAEVGFLTAREVVQVDLAIEAVGEAGLVRVVLTGLPAVAPA